MRAKSSARKSASTRPAARRSIRSADALNPKGFGGSSNGRTTDSDSVYLGSNPSPPANTASGEVRGSPRARVTPRNCGVFFCLKDAEAEATRLRVLLANGTDPAENKQVLAFALLTSG